MTSSSCRRKSFRFVFVINGERQQVCKDTAISMLNVGRKIVDQ